MFSLAIFRAILFDFRVGTFLGEEEASVDFLYTYRYIIFIGIYVCEQLPGANLSPIVAKLRQSYPWSQETR